MSWHWSETAKVSLTREQPISEYNPVALNFTTTEAGTGIANTGFWGIPVSADSKYSFSVHLKGSKDSKVAYQTRSLEFLASQLVRISMIVHHEMVPSL